MTFVDSGIIFLYLYVVCQASVLILDMGEGVSLMGFLVDRRNAPLPPPPAAISGSKPVLSFLGSASSINRLTAQGAGMVDPSSRRAEAVLLKALLRKTTKRKAYFAFRYQDIMRVNNVRNAWCIEHPDGQNNRSFYHRSIWGTSRSTNPETLKKLMREGVEHSSAVCVLVGSETWKSRWVKYEIARSVVDGRGLLSVHINGLNHAQRGIADPMGYNPLHCMGIYVSNGKYYLCENVPEVDAETGQLIWRWKRYEDFTDPVDLPRYSIPPSQTSVVALSSCTRVYDYVADQGHSKIGIWIDTAAMDVGR
jgi:hypothetical protein